MYAQYLLVNSACRQRTQPDCSKSRCVCATAAPNCHRRYNQHTWQVSGAKGGRPTAPGLAAAAGRSASGLQRAHRQGRPCCKPPAGLQLQPPPPLASRLHARRQPHPRHFNIFARKPLSPPDHHRSPSTSLPRPRPPGCTHRKRRHTPHLCNAAAGGTPRRNGGTAPARRTRARRCRTCGARAPAGAAPVTAGAAGGGGAVPARTADGPRLRGGGAAGGGHAHCSRSGGGGGQA